MRRTGKEALYERVVKSGKQNKQKESAEDREARLQALGFEPMSDEQWARNVDYCHRKLGVE